MIIEAHQQCVKLSLQLEFTFIHLQEILIRGTGSLNQI